MTKTFQTDVLSYYSFNNCINHNPIADRQSTDLCLTEKLQVLEVTPISINKQFF